MLLVACVAGVYGYKLISKNNPIQSESTAKSNTNSVSETTSSSQSVDTQTKDRHENKYNTSRQSRETDATSTIDLNTLNSEQKDAIVAYALSMKSYIDNSGQPQQFDNRLSEFSMSNAQAIVKYYEGISATGTLENPIVEMSVQSVPNTNNLIFTDTDTGKMSQISFDRIESDNSVYDDDHNQLSEHE